MITIETINVRGLNIDYDYTAMMFMAYVHIYNVISKIIVPIDSLFQFILLFIHTLKFEYNKNLFEFCWGIFIHCRFIFSLIFIPKPNKLSLFYSLNIYFQKYLYIFLLHISNTFFSNII